MAVSKSILAVSFTTLLLAMAPVSAIAQDTNTATITQSGQSNTAFSLSISDIEAVNSSIAADDLREIFSGQIAPYAAEIQHLNADSITVPELSLTISTTDENGDGETLIFTYTDLRLTGIVDGTAQSVSVGSSLLKSEGADPATFRFGEVSAKSVDFAAMLAFYGLVENENSEIFNVIYRDAVVEQGTIEAEDVKCDIGKLEFEELRARQTDVSIIDFIEIASAAEPDAVDVDPELVSELLKSAFEIASAYEYASIVLDGMTCSGVNEYGGQFEFSFGPVNVSGYSAMKYPEISVDNISIKAAEGDVSLGNFTLKQIDYANAVSTIINTEDELSEAWFEAHARELIPELEGFSFADLAIDVEGEGQPERIVASIGAGDLTLNDYLNGIPTFVSLSVDDFHFDLPKDPTDPGVMRLIDAGIEAFDLDAAFKAQWKESSETISVDQLALSAGKLGSIDVSLLLGNAGVDLFDTNPQVAMIAGLGLTAKSLGISLIDDGLMEIAIKQFAAERGMEVSSVPIMMSGMAQGLVLGFLGSNPNGADLATAIGTFLNGGKSITAKFTAIDENGISLQELNAMEDDPTWIADKITIEASAE